MAIVVFGAACSEPATPFSRMFDASQEFHDLAGTSYTFTYTSESTEWTGESSVTAVIKNDKIVEATRSDGTDVESAFTIRDFFARAEYVLGNGGEVEMEVDPEWSYPTLLRLNRLLDDLSDDRTIRIVDFVNDETPEPGVEFETIDFRVLGEGLPTDGVYVAAVLASEQDVALLTVPADVAWESVDFREQVVLRFDLAESSSCIFKDMNELRFDPNHAVIYPEVPTRGGHTCTSDALLYRILVVVDRTDLPPTDFTVATGPFLPNGVGQAEVVPGGSLTPQR